MWPLKPKKDEQLAGAEFCQIILKMAKENGLGIFKNLKEHSGKEFCLAENENQSIYDLSLALISQELLALKVLYPKEQGERIYQWVLQCLDTPETKGYPREEIKGYIAAFNRAVNMKLAQEVVLAIPEKLLYRLLGKNIEKFQCEINGKKTELLDPLLGMELAGFFSDLTVSYWKKMRKAYRLVEGHLPLEDISDGEASITKK